MSEAGGNEKVVCVTGASGFIASWLVKLLLQRGLYVNVTVRDPSDVRKTEHLVALEGAEERLRLFKADLMEEGSFDSAFYGCECVFHTASPVTFDVKDPQAELLDPAVKGTLNVLNSCVKFRSIKTMVVTSSMAAVIHNGKPRNPEVVVDESWFTNPDHCREANTWYSLSKTLAEDAASKFVEDKGLNMVILNPAMVIGPLLQPTLNGSSSAIAKLFGAETYPNTTFGWVHVKDVADAHVLAFEVPSANGRYCLAETVAHFSEIVKILRELYPNAPLPDKCADDKPFEPIYQVSKEKAELLGIDFIPLKDSLKEAVESMKEKGFINF